METELKCNHIKIGQEFKFYATSNLIGQGLPLILPKGAIVIQQLQRFVEDEEQSRGYLHTRTPLMTKSNLFELSGHLPYFKDKMFISDTAKDTMVLKAATCPFHFCIYNAQPHSCKDLPIRYSETSTLFRNASSGEMYGLIRLRQFSVSDGHIICSEEQVIDEFKKVLDLAKYYIKVLDFDSEASYTYSTWNENNKEKYIGDARLWESVQKLLYDTLRSINQDFTIKEGEAPFYGPKFDLNLKNSYGKYERIITIQLDFSLAKNFGMTYIDKDNKTKYPTIIHRTSIGSYERMLALLIEKYGGAMPTWLSQIQVKILTISEKYNDYAYTIIDKIKKHKIRFDKDLSSKTLGYKLRKALNEKTPYIVIIGEKELHCGSITVRSRSKKIDGFRKIDELIAHVLQDINTRSLEAVKDVD